MKEENLVANEISIISNKSMHRLEMHGGQVWSFESGAPWIVDQSAPISPTQYVSSPLLLALNTAKTASFLSAPSPPFVLKSHLLIFTNKRVDLPRNLWVGLSLALGKGAACTFVLQCTQVHLSSSQLCSSRAILALVSCNFCNESAR